MWIKRLHPPSTLFGRAISFVLLSLFFLIPFQRNYHRFFKSLARAIIPEGLDIPPAFSKSLTIALSDLILLTLGALLLVRYRIPLRRFFWEGPSKYLLLFSFIALISVLCSPTAHYPLHYLVILKWGMAMLLFNVLKCSLPPSSFAQWFSCLAWVVVIAAVGESLLGAAQYLCQHSLGLKWLAESSIHNFRFPNPGAERWIFDTLFSLKTQIPFLIRSAGTFGHPNPFGGFFFLSVFFTYYLLLHEKSLPCVRFLQGALFLQLFTLCTTFSRSAILALALCTLLLFFWKRRDLRFLATVLISVSLCLLLFHSQIFARGGLLNYNSVSQGADQERLLYQKIALAMIQDHPFLGVGFNNFQFQIPHYLPEDCSTVLLYQVHNIFLLIAAEMGLIGLGAFFLFLWASFRGSLRRSATLETRILFCAFLGLLFIGCCDMYPLLNLKFRLFFFAVPALLFISSQSQRAVEPH